MVRIMRFLQFVRVPLFAMQLFFVALVVCAQQPAAPDFKAKVFPNGVLYTFLGQKTAQIHYKLFEPHSGSYAEGTTHSGETVFIMNGITGAAWSETPTGKSLPIVLYPQAELPFADIDSAFISPTDGEWANKQPLVIDIPADYEAYYSLTSTDPLDSGLAYDGPVFIDMTGTITVSIALVAPNGSAFKKTITYSVADFAAFELLNAADPVIYCGPHAPLKIPPAMQYYFDSAKPVLQTASDITPKHQSDILRYVPLVIENNGEKYRYVLQTGEESSGIKAIPPVSGIEFYEWNYFSFTIGSAVSYSIDDSPWIAYKNPVYIDRTKKHTISWSSPAYKSGQTQTLLLPPKPHLIGAPKSDITNAPVTISISDEGFVLRHETAKHKSDFLHSVLFDVLPGEEFTFTTDLSVYYNGIRQGTLATHFTIDKQPTLAPILKATTEVYAAKPVEITVETDSDVFIRILEKPVQLTLGQTPDFSVFASYPPFENFKPFTGTIIQLVGTEKSAVLYQVQAYSLDKAGNRSKTVSYNVCVDSYTIFVSQAEEGSSRGNGSPIEPYSSFADAIEAAGSRTYSKIIVSGTYQELAGFTIQSNCEISARQAQTATLHFTDSAIITVTEGASLTLRSMTLVQEGTLDLPNAQNRQFFELQKATLMLDNSRISLNGNGAKIGIIAHSSALTVKNSHLEINAASYSAALEAFSSNVVFDTTQFFCTAAAVELFTLNGGHFALNKSECSVAANVGRIAGLTNTTFAITLNSFIKTGGNAKIMQNAVQANEGSQAESYSGNTVSAFAPDILWVK